MIEFRDVSKSFGGVAALDRVSFRVESGECHGLMGENGAGKSTLGKVLCGIHRPDSGEVRIDGVSRRLRSPADAREAGVAMVHQELALCADLSVAENLCLGRYPRRQAVGLRWLLDRGAMARRARDLLARIGVELDVEAPVGSLSTAQEQLVQVAAAVGTGADVLVFDEPTSSLSEAESEHLFGLIEDLRRRGLTLLYVSHRLPEVFRLCDRMTVLRDGRHVQTVPREGTDPDQLVRLMIGRDLERAPAARAPAPEVPVVLDVRGLSSPGLFDDVCLSVRAGEILGVAGLVGAGRSDVLRALFGLDGSARGDVRVADREGRLQRLPLGDVTRAMAAQLALVPEDRKREGLVLSSSVLHNASLSRLDALRGGWRRAGCIDRGAERRQTTEALTRLDVRAASLDLPVGDLSGGNQQKIVLAKWLMRTARVLLVDEPTRGVDVGAKASIHELLAEHAATGACVVLVSSELPELLALASRIVVMRGGRLVGEVARDDADEESLMRLMAGVTQPTPSRAPPG